MIPYKILSKRIAERSAYCKQKFWYVRESSLLYYQGYWKKFQKKLYPDLPPTSAENIRLQTPPPNTQKKLYAPLKNDSKNYRKSNFFQFLLDPKARRSTENILTSYISLGEKCSCFTAFEKKSRMGWVVFLIQEGGWMEKGGLRKKYGILGEWARKIFRFR